MSDTDPPKPKGPLPPGVVPGFPIDKIQGEIGNLLGGVIKSMQVETELLLKKNGASQTPSLSDATTKLTKQMIELLGDVVESALSKSVAPNASSDTDAPKPKGHPGREP
jgi:hypothetical protein